MQRQPHEIQGLIVDNYKRFSDSRGSFSVPFNYERLYQLGVPNHLKIRQTNIAQSHGIATIPDPVVRGLHYQEPPYGQYKVATVIGGSVYDVAVDLRPSSPTYLDWTGIELSAENCAIFCIPEGFAHGYRVISEVDTVFMYAILGGQYRPDHEGGILWKDPRIAIDWGTKNPTVSEKDAALLPFDPNQVIFNL